MRPTAERLAVGPKRWSPRQAVEATWHYLDEQFPPGQALSLMLTPIVSYLLYGRIAGDLELDAGTIAVALVVVVLFLQYRLTDDVCTYYNRELGGPEVIPARPGPMMLGVLATVPVVLLLESHATPLLVALVALAAMIVCSFFLAIGERLPVSRYVPQVPFIELIPLAIFAYVYFGWEAQSGESLPLLSVVAVMGTVASGFQFWKWSRHLGDDPVERIYRMSWNSVRGVLVAILAASLAFQVLLYDKAGLSPGYLAWAVASCVAFAVLAWPRGRNDDHRPWWAGLAFPTALLAGLYVQLLLLA